MCCPINKKWFVSFFVVVVLKPFIPPHSIIENLLLKRIAFLPTALRRIMKMVFINDLPVLNYEVVIVVYSNTIQEVVAWRLLVPSSK